MLTPATTLTSLPHCRKSILVWFSLSPATPIIVSELRATGSPVPFATRAARSNVGETAATRPAVSLRRRASQACSAAIFFYSSLRDFITKAPSASPKAATQIIARLSVTALSLRVAPIDLSSLICQLGPVARTKAPGRTVRECQDESAFTITCIAVTSTLTVR